MRIYVVFDIIPVLVHSSQYLGFARNPLKQN